MTQPEETRAYYNEFAKRYERERRPNQPGGYHALIDDLEVELVERYGRGKDVLEVGCGTGLLLERFAQFARSAKGIDLSPGMLHLATARGLDAREASATAIPFDDQLFDVVCSFKVLAHVPEIGRALAEMARVTRSGGVVLAEFYNPLSLRALGKKLGPAGAISDKKTEADVFTRFDAPWVVRRLLPPSLHFETARGIRVFTPVASAMKVPVLSGVLRRAERWAADSPLGFFGGFYVAVLRKR